MFGRSDFKWRLMNLNGTSLLDNKDLVDAVHNCLDLSTIKPGFKYSILPGRPHTHDRLDEVRARRELTTCLYASQQEAGVNLNPLRFEEARYVNEVTGAMLVWIHRIFAQHNELMRVWKQLSIGVDEAMGQVRRAKRAVADREEALEALLEEQRILREQRLAVAEQPKPTELTTTDQIVLDRPSPNVFFQNGRIAGRSAGSGPAVAWELPPRYQLPPSIFFYVRLKHVRVSFPLPPRYPASRYLFEASIVEGQEASGPVAYVPFDAAHVIGLGEQDLLSFTQLVIEVPSTPGINPGIMATRLSFHPRHAAQLHDQSKRMRRIIVPVFASGGVSSDWTIRQPRPSSAPHQRQRSPDRRAAAQEAMERLHGYHDILGMPPLLATADVSQLDFPTSRIPRSPSPTIGSPFNAEALIARHGSPKRRVPAPLPPAEERKPTVPESLMAPLIERVENGYVLLAEELQELKRLASLADAARGPAYE